MLLISPRHIRLFSTRVPLRTSELGTRVQGVSLIARNIKPVIGLEVHAQLDTETKLFSRGANKREASPNSQLDLLDVSIPGALPQLNRSSLRAALVTGIGLNCTIQNVIHFDRKNYFYTDMPAGYQITQYNKPIALDGYIEFIVTPYNRSFATNFAHSQHYDMVRRLYFDWWRMESEPDSYLKRSHIKQLQLEQDSAKTLNQMTGNSRDLNNLVDYNRSGAGLLEIVFDPDLSSPDEASSLVRELIMILRSLKTCDCELQEGSLRVDANVSIDSIDGQKIPATEANRVELKNLNSLRSLHRGISYEIHRQAQQLILGERVNQESRTFDTRTGQTSVLREKETAVDYRYVPEPNIPPLKIDNKVVEEVRQNLAKDVVLPIETRQLLQNKYRLSLALIAELIGEPGLAQYFISIMDSDESAGFDSDSVADFLIYSVRNLKSISNLPIKVDLNDDNEHSDFRQRLEPAKIRELLKMAFNDEISFTTAYETMKCLFTTSDERQPRALVEQLGWLQINDEQQIDEMCEKLIKQMKSISKRYQKRGERKDLRYMLDKLNELYDNRVSVRVAMSVINRRLNPPKLDQDKSVGDEIKHE